jgi:hypothetical protein
MKAQRAGAGRIAWGVGGGNTRLVASLVGDAKERPSFLEKKKQKTFARCRGLTISTRFKKQKFFGSFFQKRTFFLPQFSPACAKKRPVL